MIQPFERTLELSIEHTRAVKVERDRADVLRAALHEIRGVAWSGGEAPRLLEMIAELATNVLQETAR